MSTMKKKVYVGCALTHAPQSYRDEIHRLKEILRKECIVLDFVGLDGDVTKVFEHDTKCVKECDVFLADCTYPSIGLGYELGVAFENNKQIVAIAHSEARVSNIVLSAAHPKFTFLRYTHFDDAIDLILHHIRKHG